MGGRFATPQCGGCRGDFRTHTERLGVNDARTNLCSLCIRGLGLPPLAADREDGPGSLLRPNAYPIAAARTLSAAVTLPAKALDLLSAAAMPAAATVVSSGTECGICRLEQTSLYDWGVFACGHLQCKTCMIEFFKSTQGSSKKTCPFCRISVDTFFPVEAYAFHDQETISTKIREADAEKESYESFHTMTAASRLSTTRPTPPPPFGASSPTAMPFGPAGAEPADPAALTHRVPGRAWGSGSNCFHCGQHFSFPFKTKHHCRECGDLVCGNCSRRDFFSADSRRCFRCVPRA